MTKQLGISPKILTDLATTVVGFVLAKYAVGLDPVIAAAIGKVAGTVAAFFASPGSVVTVAPEQ